MNERALFDASTLQHQECPVPHCGAILSAGQSPPILTCAHDLEREGKRPRQCLNHPKPEHTDIPY